MKQNKENVATKKGERERNEEEENDSFLINIYIHKYMYIGTDRRRSMNNINGAVSGSQNISDDRSFDLHGRLFDVEDFIRLDEVSAVEEEEAKRTFPSIEIVENQILLGLFILLLLPLAGKANGPMKFE